MPIKSAMTTAGIPNLAAGHLLQHGLGQHRDDGHDGRERDTRQQLAQNAAASSVRAAMSFQSDYEAQMRLVAVARLDESLGERAAILR